MNNNLRELCKLTVWMRSSIRGDDKVAMITMRCIARPLSTTLRTRLPAAPRLFYARRHGTSSNVGLCVCCVVPSTYSRCVIHTRSKRPHGLWPVWSWPTHNFFILLALILQLLPINCDGTSHSRSIALNVNSLEMPAAISVSAPKVLKIRGHLIRNSFIPS